MLDDLIADLFSSTCHQWTDRCLVVGDVVFPLCARCMGTYLGVAVVGFWWLALGLCGRRPCKVRWASCLAVSAIGLCLADGLSGASHSWTNGHVFRFTLGFAAGLGGSLLLTRWVYDVRPGAVTKIGSVEAGLVVLMSAAILIVAFAELHDVLIGLALFGFVCSRGLVLFAAARLVWRLLAVHREGEWRAVGILRDITERKKAEELARRNEDISPSHRRCGPMPSGIP